MPAMRSSLEPVTRIAPTFDSTISLTASNTVASPSMLTTVPPFSARIAPIVLIGVTGSRWAAGASSRGTASSVDDQASKRIPFREARKGLLVVGEALEEQVVSPDAADQEVLPRDADLGEPVSPQDPLRGGVVEQRPGLEAMQRELAERELDRVRKGAAGEAAAVPSLIDPVADGRALQRAADDLGERDRAGNRAAVVDDRDPQPVAAREPLGLPVRREERLGARRLERREEVAVRDSQPGELGDVAGRKAPDRHARARAARRRRR